MEIDHRFLTMAAMMNRMTLQLLELAAAGCEKNTIAAPPSSPALLPISAPPSTTATVLKTKTRGAPQAFEDASTSDSDPEPPTKLPFILIPNNKYGETYKKLRECGVDAISCLTASGGFTCLYTFTEANFRTIKNILKTNGALPHSHVVPSDGEPEVTYVMRGVNPRMPMEDIVAELEEGGFPLLRTPNRVMRNGMPHYMIFVTVPNNERGRQIRNMRLLDGYTITVEDKKPPITSSIMPDFRKAMQDGGFNKEVPACSPTTSTNNDELPMEIRELMKYKRRMHKRWQRTGDPALKTAWHGARRELQAALQEFRLESSNK